MSQQEEIPQKIKNDFSDYFRTELYKHYIHDPSGIRLILDIAKQRVNNDSLSDEKDNAMYKVGQMMSFRSQFENDMEEALPWAQGLIVDYMDRNSIPSGQFRRFRSIAVEIALALLEEKI